MAYTTIKKSSDYFNTKLYTGNGGTNAITGVGFQPDFVWLKSRSEASTDHKLFDAVRGVPNFLSSNLTDAETSTGSFNSIDSDGFTVDTTNAAYNQSSATYASWNWKANGTGSANTDGSISSTVSASATSGFSIVSYTGTGATGTVGHGLGVAPKMIIVKRRSEVSNWDTYNSNLGNNKVIELNTTSAAYTDNTWNSTTPTSSVFTVGNNNVNGNSVTHIAYCFADVQGYSKFGSYTGNGSADGTFIYTGFKPAFFLVKRTDLTSSWTLLDNKRDPFNVTTERLFPNENVAGSVGINANTDFLSNGVKIRVNHGNFNASGGTYIYMAFAEEPLVGDNPATAR